MEIGMNITIFEHDSIVFKHIIACISNMFQHVLRGFLGFETYIKFTKRKLTLYSFVSKVVMIMTAL
jgi:hypothetical protein